MGAASCVALFSTEEYSSSEHAFSEMAIKGAIAILSERAQKIRGACRLLPLFG